MNYRHSYHAGNFADVVKHNLLLLLLDSLKRKETPFCYLETHAGAGGYSLLTTAAQTTQEFQLGIGQLLKVTTPLPPSLQKYVDLIRSFNQQELRYYPGSPQLASMQLRPQDRAILIELHPEEVMRLKQKFAGEKRIAVHHLDGYQGLKAFLPPLEKRGLVFLDPPFERAKESDQLIQGLKVAHQRWSNGLFAIWYPIKERREINAFHGQLKRSGLAKILIAELCIFPDDTSLRLNGSGMVIINPPWQLDHQLRSLLSALLDCLSHDPYGRQVVRWLV